MSQQVDLSQLSVEQLASIKSQLDDEINHLTSSFAALKAAEARFRRGKDAVDALPGAQSKRVLIPLTPSLYVPGKLKEDSGSVIVDVGTGYYVRKTFKEAKTYYNLKTLDLRKQTDRLQPTIEKKQEDRSIISSMLQQRLSERERSKPKKVKD